MKSLFNPSLVVIGSLLLMPVPVQAQEQDVTAEDVESYVRQIQQDAVEMMDASDPRRLVEWADRNIAEDAMFQVSVSVLTGDEPKAFSSMTLETEDIRRMVGVLAGAFKQGAFEDYSLEAEVTDVVSHGPGAATATVRWHESFTLNAAGMLGNGQQTQENESAVSVDATATCSHLFQRQDGHLAMGLTTCTAEMRF